MTNGEKKGFHGIMQYLWRVQPHAIFKVNEDAFGEANC